MGEKHVLSESELRQHLDEQIGFIQGSTKAFDDGAIAEAARLAVPVRVMLHSTDRSHALIDQLGMGDVKMVNTCVVTNGCPAFIGFVYHDGVQTFRAPLGPMIGVKQTIADWWNQEVLVAEDDTRFTRREIVLNLANKDGGAHVDPKQTGTFHRLGKKNGLGTGVFGTRVPTYPNDPHRYAMRQIAHEVLLSLVEGYREPERPPLKGLVIGRFSRPAGQPMKIERLVPMGFDKNGNFGPSS